jgi:hypothetical protein
MAKSTSPKPKLSAEEKKAAKAAGKVARKERWSQIWQAFQMQRKEDKQLLPILIGTLVLVAAVVTVVAVLLDVFWWIGLILGILLGVLVAMIVFARRVQSNVYKQADGQPGAAAWSLQNNLRGRWRITPAVAGTTQLDAVHRVIGRPGIVLVAEGAPHRVKPLLAQEKKRLARVVGDKTPIYDFIVGNEEGQTPLKKLNSVLVKLPRNISPTDVTELDARLASLAKAAPQAGLPKGPLPAGARMRNVQRAAKRSGSRSSG